MTVMAKVFCRLIGRFKLIDGCWPLRCASEIRCCAVDRYNYRTNRQKKQGKSFHEFWLAGVFGNSSSISIQY